MSTKAPRNIDSEGRIAKDADPIYRLKPKFIGPSKICSSHGENLHEYAAAALTSARAYRNAACLLDGSKYREQASVIQAFACELGFKALLCTGCNCFGVIKAHDLRDLYERLDADLKTAIDARMRESGFSTAAVLDAFGDTFVSGRYICEWQGVIDWGFEELSALADAVIDSGMKVLVSNDAVRADGTCTK